MFQSWAVVEPCERAPVVYWLTKPTPETIKSPKDRYLMELLYVSLLNDLLRSFEGHHSPEQATPKASWYAGIKFAVVWFSGVILAICEGYAGISSLLLLVGKAPAAVVFSLGLLFALLSVVVFYGFGLVEIAKNLGVKLSKSRQLLDLYLEEVAIIERFTLLLKHSQIEATKEELQQIEPVLEMLIARHQALEHPREVYNNLFKKKIFVVAKLFITVSTGVLFFSGGFFAGQYFAMAIAGLFTSAVSATFWPIVLVSLLIGLAALATYWYIERPGLEHVVSRWFGLEKDDVDKFAASKAHIGKLKKLLGFVNFNLSKLNPNHASPEHPLNASNSRGANPNLKRANSMPNLFKSYEEPELQSQNMLDKGNRNPSLGNEGCLIQPV